MPDQTYENADNSSGLANDLFTALAGGLTIPDAPDFSGSQFNVTPDETSALYEDVASVGISDVTDGCLDGEGAFDKFMTAMDKHLEREFKGNRITGSQYAEAYVQIANGIMGNATSFALQKDQSRWQAITAQMQARIAEIQATQALIELEKTKFETVQAQFAMNLTAAQFGLTKMQIATEEANHDSVTADVAIKHFQRNYQMPADLAITQYERTAVMPSTVAMNNVQVDRILPAQAAVAEFQNRVLQPLERDLQIIQRDRILPVTADIEEFRRDNMLPVELGQQQHILNFRQPAETSLVKEQTEVQRASTLGTRSDGLTVIGGTIGKQIELLNTQITLTGEQTESERAKTLDTRTDGATVEGSVGKQKDLYDQQIDSFIKDAAHKTAKMYLDGWITQKTLDEGLNAPNQLTNTNIDSVLATVRSNNSL